MARRNDRWLIKKQKGKNERRRFLLNGDSLLEYLAGLDYDNYTDVTVLEPLTKKYIVYQPRSSAT